MGKKRRKLKDQIFHARCRFEERVGIKLTEALRQLFVRQINDGTAPFIEKQSNTRSVFQLTHEGKTFYVVYDKLRKNIATVLPASYQTSSDTDEDEEEFRE